VSGTFQRQARLDPWNLTAAGSAGFLATFDDAGNCLRADVLTGEGVLPYEVAAGEDGSLWVAGWFRDALELGGHRVVGGHDASFVARLAPSGGD
jgi:hypothetical protein